jgi:hypothetical protein
MEKDYWRRQEVGKPLFPELEWSRPENKAQAGKLLIVGGNLHGFAAPAEAYATAAKAGIGSARVLLPSAVRKIVGSFLENGEFAPSTPSGSFNQKALDELILQSNWADAVLVAGDLGRNSETAILMEKFLSKSRLAITITKDAVDYITSAPNIALNRPDTLLVLSLSQLQRLNIAAKSTNPVSFSMDLLHLIEWLHQFTLIHKPYIIVKHLDNLFVAVNGQVSSTKLVDKKSIWRLETAARASVWWLQNPSKPFEALTASVYS